MFFVPVKVKQGRRAKVDGFRSRQVRWSIRSGYVFRRWWDEDASGLPRRHRRESSGSGNADRTLDGQVPGERWADPFASTDSSREEGENVESTMKKKLVLEFTAWVHGRRIFFSRVYRVISLKQ